VLGTTVVHSDMHTDVSSFFKVVSRLGVDCSSCVFSLDYVCVYLCLQCFDAVGWAAGRAPGL